MAEDSPEIVFILIITRSEYTNFIINRLKYMHLSNAFHQTGEFCPR